MVLPNLSRFHLSHFCYNTCRQEAFNSRGIWPSPRVIEKRKACSLFQFSFHFPPSLHVLPLPLHAGLLWLANLGFNNGEPADGYLCGVE